MSGKITITNKSPKVAVVDIEGVIGVPEQWQFEEPGMRITTYEKFRKVLEELKNVEAKDVVVNIRSTGGNVNDALLIFDALSGLNATVTTRCFGYVASAATIIAQAASEGRREISANALYLIHKSVCATEGNAEEMARSLDMLGKTDQRIAAIYAARSGKPVENYAELMGENNGNGRWLSPEEALEYKLADRITGSVPIEDDAKELVKNFGLPPIPDHAKTDGKNYKRRMWDAILEKVGLVNEIRKKETERNVSPDQETIDEMARAQAEISEKHKQEVEQLKNKISILETQNARLAVGPTVTMPKEDPSINEVKRTSNEEAYFEDMQRFRL